MIIGNLFDRLFRRIAAETVSADMFAIAALSAFDIVNVMKE